MNQNEVDPTSHHIGLTATSLGGNDSYKNKKYQVNGLTTYYLIVQMQNIKQASEGQKITFGNKYCALILKAFFMIDVIFVPSNLHYLTV